MNTLYDRALRELSKQEKDQTALHSILRDYEKHQNNWLTLAMNGYRSAGQSRLDGIIVAVRANLEN